MFPISQVEAVALHLRDPTAGHRGVHFLHNDRSRRKSRFVEVRSSGAQDAAPNIRLVVQRL